MIVPNAISVDDKYRCLSRRKQGKRILASEVACKAELKKELYLLFNTFNEALDKVNRVLLSFPPQSRSRTLEASVMQSMLAECLMNSFEGKAFYGKYKRLILRTKGYIILFKKLDGKGRPMNIRTINVQSILNQSQVLDLFADTDYNDEPILYFGYQKNRFGQVVNPQVIYIDEDQIKFSITSADIEFQLPLHESKEDNITEVAPKLKGGSGLKKAN